MITHLEPDILEYEVKWALGSITTIKTSGGDGNLVELFQILKDDAVKVLYSICQQIWKTQQWPQDWKRSVFIPIPKKGNAKECSNYHAITLISHASNAQNSPSQASAIREPRTSRCSNWFYKRQRNQRSNCQHPLDHGKSKRVLENHLFLLYWLCQSLWLWITINCGKFWKRWEYQTTWPASWEICMQIRSGSKS